MPSCTEIGRWPIPPGGELCVRGFGDAILAETGCYADLTMPTSVLNGRKSGKRSIASTNGAAAGSGRTLIAKATTLVAGRAAKTFPLIIQGPTRRRYRPHATPGRKPAIENGEINEGVR